MSAVIGLFTSNSSAKGATAMATFSISAKLADVLGRPSSTAKPTLSVSCSMPVTSMVLTSSVPRPMCLSAVFSCLPKGSLNALR